jgi:hypothetical protein
MMHDNIYEGLHMKFKHILKTHIDGGVSSFGTRVAYERPIG